MSWIAIQLGQCGNQLGSAFFQRMHNELSAWPDGSRERAGEPFFREGRGSAVRRFARAVLLDMEPKASVWQSLPRFA